MTKIIHTEITIQSTPENVWEVFTDFKNYTQWNSFIKSISGEIKVGNKIKVRIEPPGAGGMTLNPKVLVFEKNKQFTWRGHLIIPGLFDGEHNFELIKNPNGTTTFHHSEKFNGILVPLLKKMLDVNTMNGFNLMNKQLKELVEKKN